MRKPRTRSSLKKKSSNKKVKGAKPTTYDGIDFKSRLEVVMYKALIEAGIEFEYEKHKYVLMEGFKYNAESIEQVGTEFKNNSRKTMAITYTPDFVAKDESWVIETKGYATKDFRMKWKLFKLHLSTWKSQPTLYMPKNQKHINDVIAHIKNN